MVLICLVSGNLCSLLNSVLVCFVSVFVCVMGFFYECYLVILGGMYGEVVWFEKVCVGLGCVGGIGQFELVDMFEDLFVQGVEQFVIVCFCMQVGIVQVNYVGMLFQVDEFQYLCVFQVVEYELVVVGIVVQWVVVVFVVYLGVGEEVVYVGEEGGFVVE